MSSEMRWIGLSVSPSGSRMGSGTVQFSGSRGSKSVPSECCLSCMMWQLPVHMSGLPARSLGVPSGLTRGPSKQGMNRTDSLPPITCSSGAQKQPVIGRSSLLRSPHASRSISLACPPAASESASMESAMRSGIWVLPSFGSTQLPSVSSVAMNMNIGLPLKFHANTDGSARSTANGTG